MVITMPAEASAQLLGLGSKLYPSNIPCMLNNVLPDLCRVFLEYAEIKQAKKKALLAGCMSVTLSE